ncbi:hypothetical protein PORY_001256 [Pneumocystis oryctolagi]|uniref:Uncharacterized protein n=1 Tax=Pneumocystis oryctolagi TaxID=42067 RepID=A0ACB7CBG6_9ASCO|nr:hypothetical protein PORY_001256 [Pneumocystis oryctolagi]
MEGGMLPVWWEVWNTIRVYCQYDYRVGGCLRVVAFRMEGTLPEPVEMARWFAEPVGLLVVRSDIFTFDAENHPVLPEAHQAFYTKFARVWIVLINVICVVINAAQLKPNVLLCMSDESCSIDDSLPYLQHLRDLEQNMGPATAMEAFADGYQDYLQVPLQPLADNLESVTYGVFEKDHVKYRLYETAIYRALMDRFKSNDLIYIAVVGAGRGPLVSMSLKAASRANRKIVLYAIEKNPNAFITLQYRNRSEWNNTVHLVNVDMRLWESPVLMDIIISELLGSLGDNELSPECLDGAQRFINPNDGIFIPSSYTAYITPLMTPKLYGNILRMKDPSAFESFYVVWLHSMYYLVQDNENRFQALWKFSHPNSDYSSCEKNSNLHNTRRSKNTFNVSSKGILHGFAGYFEAVLYDDIELSTRPDMIDIKSKDMISWFPAFFPLKVPLYIPSNSQIDLYFWRQTDSKKVWYEWLTESLIMNVFSFKKSECVVDSEGEDDSSFIETTVDNNVNNMHVFHQNELYKLKENSIDDTMDKKPLNSLITGEKLPVLMFKDCQKNAEDKDCFFSEEKNTMHYNPKEGSHLYNGNCSVDTNIQDGLCYTATMAASDDEIQLLPLFKQTKTNLCETINDKSIVSSEKDMLSNKSIQISRLCPQENQEICLFPLTTHIDENCSYMNEYEYKNNETGSKKNQISQKREKKIRRCKTARDNMQKNEKIKRYSSVDSCHDYVGAVNGISSTEHYELANDSPEIFSKNTVELNKCFLSKNFDHEAPNSISDYCSDHHSLSLNDGLMKTISNDLEVYEADVSKSVNHEKNRQLSTEDGLKIPESSCKQGSENLQIKTCLPISRTVEIENVLESMDVNIVQSLDDKDALNSKNQQLTSSEEICNTVDTSLASLETRSILKKPVRKTTTKPYYRVGLSKKVKIESLHSYLKK